MVDPKTEANIVYEDDNNIKTIKKKPVWISRKIVLNISGKHKNENNYPKNKYSSSKYNYLQFIAVTFWKRCKRIPIMMGLISLFISFFVNMETKYRWLFLGPSLFFSILPPFIVDLYTYTKTRIADNKINNKLCFVFESNKMEFVLTKWKDVKVGDLICVLDGERFPADVVILHSSGKMAYISLEMVDGSRLKRACEPACNQTDFERAIKDMILTPGKITCDVPSDDIYHFEGSLKWEGKPRAISLTKDNFVQMFSKLTFANWVLAIVVYAGNDTKIACKRSFETKSRYHPRIRFENVLSFVLTFIFIIFIIFLFIHMFINSESTFENYSNYLTGKNSDYYHIYNANWHIMVEFILIFNMCVPITVAAVTDLIRIFEFIKLSFNKPILNDNDYYLNLTKNESRNNSFLLASKYLSKINNSNIILNNKNQYDANNGDKNNLEFHFHKYESLDSLGEVDFSLISQDSIMEAEPMRLKFISLNNGQDYVFKSGLEVNASPKFSIISGLVWRHHSISWHRNELSRFINGCMRVVRPTNKSSMFNSEVIHPKKLELFNYHSVISAISRLSIFKQKNYNDNLLISNNKSNNSMNDNDRIKMRKYYKKLIFQIKGFRNAYLDEPSDNNPNEYRDAWPPLASVRVKKNRSNSNKNVNKINLHGLNSNSYHPALPIHLFPIRLTRLLKHIILSNKGDRVSKSKLNENHSDTNSHEYENKKDHNIFYVKGRLISKEEKEEMLYLLFKNITKLTNSFYGWRTNQKYELFDEYSAIVKNLLIETINYTLKSSFYNDNTTESKKSDVDNNTEYSFSSGLNIENGLVENYNYPKDLNSNNTILTDMLYAMAICNSSVPHLRIVETKYKSIDERKLYKNNQNQCEGNCEINGESKTLYNRNSISRSSNYKLNYRNNFGSESENGTINQLSRCSLKNSLVSFNDLSSNRSGRRLYLKSKDIIKDKVNNIKFSPIKKINRFCGKLKIVKNPKSTPTPRMYSQGNFELSKDKSNTDNNLIMYRYNKEYEKLHNQRRKGNLIMLSREIMLTKYFIKYGSSIRNDELERNKENVNDISDKIQINNNKINPKTEKKGIFSSNYKKNEFKNISKRLKYSFKSDKTEKINRHYENHPKSYVQYSGIDESDLTIVNTAASFGMRLVLVNSQHIVVESLGRTIFASLIYKYEDTSNDEISMIVKFPQIREPVIYTRGIARNILPFINPQSIKSNIGNGNNISCHRTSSSLHSGHTNNVKNYDDLLYITRKLDYQGYKVYIYAKKVLSKTEQDRIALRRNLVEKSDHFKFLLNTSTEDCYLNIRNNLSYLGYIGIEYRIQDKVPKTIKLLTEYSIKPWFLFKISSTNSIRLLHKIFPNYDKIPLIRMDRLPLSNKRKTTTFLVKVYNELKIIVKNNYLILEDIDSDKESSFENDKNHNHSDNPAKKSTLTLNKKYSDVEFLNNLITISTLNGEVQLSQLYNNIASDSCEIAGNVTINEWLTWCGNLPGHGIVNSLPGIVFSALQLSRIFQSRDLTNYFFSIATICPYVVISDSMSNDIGTITDYLRSNVVPKPVILGISGNTGNISTLSSCDISISVSNIDLTNNKNYSYSKNTFSHDTNINSYSNNGNNHTSNSLNESGRKRASISINNRNINKNRDSSIIKGLNNKDELYYVFPNKRKHSIKSLADKNNHNNSHNSDYVKYNNKCGVKKGLHKISVTGERIKQHISNTILTPTTDITISKFHQIIPILTRIGRITSYRTGMALYNNLFKIFYLTLPHLIFQFYCQWSGTLVYSIDLLTFFAVFVTVLPPISYGFTGIDLPPKFIDLPFLYILSKNGYFTNWLTYVYYLTESIFLSIISFYFGILIVKNTSPFSNGISSDLLDLSGSQTLYCIIGSLFSFVIKSKSFSYLYLITIPLIILSTIIALFILNLKGSSYSYLYYIYGFSENKSYTFLLTVPLFISYLVIFNIIWKIILYHFYPNPATSVRDWWLIHIKQYTDYCKKKVRNRMYLSLRNSEYKELFKETALYIKTFIRSEWIIIKNHINIGVDDNSSRYLNYLIIKNIKIPTLIDSLSTRYQNYLSDQIKKRKESFKKQNIQSSGVNSNSNVVFQPQINIIQPQIINSSTLHNKIEQDTYCSDLNGNHDKNCIKDCIVGVKKNLIAPIDEKIVVEDGVSNNEMNNSINASSIIESNNNSGCNLIISSSSTGNYLSYSDSIHLKKSKFTKPLKINYFGDNRIFLDKFEGDIENLRLFVYIHAITIWNPKQIYISGLVPMKKLRIKGIKSLQFVQSLTKYSREEKSNYIYLMKEYTNILNDNRISNITFQHSNNCNTNNNSINTCNNTFLNQTSIIHNHSNNMENVVNTLTSITSLNKNIKSSTISKKRQDSTLDLNINIINNSSNYGRINKFSDDVKLLLNPYKLTFKVKQLELEYQRERQIETYQQRYAIRVVLFVLSLILLKFGPFAINLTDTNYIWVRIMRVLFCIFLFINFCLTYVSGKYSLNVRSQFPLLTLISVTSIVSTTHGFTLVVVFPILSFIIFRLGFIKGLYLTIIGFICVIIGQFIWEIKSIYLIRFLPILIGINAFCGFLGYRSELLYRAQFLLKTYTNDLRERQRQILYTMLPSFIVERLIKYQHTNNSMYNNKHYERNSSLLTDSLMNKKEQLLDNGCIINNNYKIMSADNITKSVNYYKNGVEDRGIVSVLFCDIYDFQSIVEVLQPTKLVSLLDKFFLILDCLIDKYNCTKIETVFETYLIASCLDPYNSEDEDGYLGKNKIKGKQNERHSNNNSDNEDKINKKSLTDLINLLRFGLRMHKISSTIFFEIPINNSENDNNTNVNINNKSSFNGDIILTESELSLKQLKLKIGIHSGKVISGVVGKNKPQYALFGDTVNTASRMKSLCDPTKIQVSSSTYNIIKDITVFKWRERRSFVKGKGIMDTYILESVIGSAYPNFTLISKEKIRGKGVNSVQVGDYVIKLYPDFDILNEYNSNYTTFQLSLLPSNLKNDFESNSNTEKSKKSRVKKSDREDDQVITKIKIANLMDMTLCFRNNHIEQKYLLYYYSSYTTLKTIEESLVIVVVTLVLQTLIYSVLPCESSKNDDGSNFRILWTVRIVYISSILLSWLVLFSNYTSHQFRNTNYSASDNKDFYDESSTIMSNSSIRIENKNNRSNDSQKQMNYENQRHIGGPILFLNAVLAGGASILMLTILWQFTMVKNSISLWCDEEIIELLLLVTVHHNAGLLFRYIILFDLLILFLLATIVLTRININIEGMTVYVISLLINIIAAYLRERTGRTIYYSSLIAGNYEKKAQELLITMLPKKVLIDFQEDKLKSAYIHKNVTFIFSDICGFTQWAMSVEAENVVCMLSTLYAQFDESLSKFGLFKLFTIGDAYVAMSEPEFDINEEIMERIKNSSVYLNNSNISKTGLEDINGNNLATNGFNEPNDSNNGEKNCSRDSHLSQDNSVSFSNVNSSYSITNQRNIELIKKFKMCNIQGYSPEEGARRSVAMAHDMLDKISIIRERLNIPNLNMRIGLHYGECIGGIVGSSRIRYEVWGHDIIIGNKMESCGSPGNITISGQLYDVLNKNFGHLFKFNYIGSVLIKKQNIDMYRTKMRKNIQLKVNTFSNSKNVSNIIKRSILQRNLKN
ncbi:hypothetical protein RS030_198 [Cryptosporidium xiaoi]|uniref:Guanylate cyclase domain-containing protein n=1 Tax=Cryptosporidium xiaoi TaxID=659607 RepID=A0AAV9XYV5_9CRYT